MKNYSINILLIITSLFFVFSCNKEIGVEDNLQTPETFVYTFGIGSADASSEFTKSVLQSDANGLYMAWESTDKLNSWAYSTVTNKYSYNNESSVNTTDDPVTFQITSYQALNEKDMVYCKYPYATGAGTSPEAVSMTISSSQTQNRTVFNTSSMPMVSLPFEMPSSVASQSNAKAGDVLFYNVGSLIEFDIFSSTGAYKDETIESVQFTSTDAIAGNFTMDLTAISESDPSTLDITGYSVKSVTTTIEETLSVGSATSKDNATKVFMVVAPGDYTGTVVVNTNLAQYTYTISSAISFKRAGVKRLGLNLEKENARVVPAFYRLVDSENEDYSGTYLVVYNGKAMDGSDVENASNTTTSVTVSDDKIEETAATKSLEVTVAADGEHYTLKDKNGKYIYMSSATSSIGVSTDKQFVDFEFADNQLKCKTTDGVYLKCKDGNKTKFYTGNNPLVSFYLLDGTGVSLTKVADPVITCANNIVTITCTTKNAVIYYTIDNSVPSSSNGNTYSAPFAINATTTVKAIATRTGIEDSNVVENTCSYVALEHNLAISGAALTEESGVYTLALENAKDSEASISVTSNYEWEVMEQSNTGYTIVSTTGTTGNGTITVKANDDNDNTTVANLGVLRVKEKTGSLYKDINIEQAPKGSAPAAGTVLWKDTFSSAYSAVTDFSKAPAVSTYDYAGRTGYSTNATSVTLTADSNVVLSSATAGGVSGGHLWFNKQKQGVLTTSAISIFSATNLTLSFNKAKGSVKAEYSTDNSTWTVLGTFTTNASTASYNFTVDSGTSSVYIRLTEGNNSNALRVDDITLAVTSDD